MVRTQVFDAMPVFAICFLAAIFEGIDSQIMALAVPQMATAWRHSPPAFALVFSFTSLGTAFGAIMGGRLSDRIGGKLTLAGAMLGLGLLTLTISLIDTIPSLIALRFLGGLCLGASLVTVVTITSENSSPKHRMRNTMMVYTAVPLGGMLGALLGGFLFKFADWRLIFYAGGLFALVIVPAVVGVLPGKLGQGAPRKATRAVPGRTRGADGLFSKRYWARTVSLCGAVFISLSAIFMMNSWLPTLLAKATGSASEASYLTSLSFAGSVVGVITMASVVNRVGAERLLTTVFLIAGGACFYINVAIQQPGPLVIAALLIVGIGMLGGQITLYGLGASIYPDEMRGRGVGMAMGVGRIGGLLGPAAGGAALASPMYQDQVFSIIGSLVVASAAAVVVLGYTRRQAGRTKFAGAAAE